MTTEKWVWIGVTLLALFVGGAAWEGIRPKCPPPETVVNIPTQIKWDTVSIPFYPARPYTRYDTITAHDTVIIPVQVYAMDTTAPITATIITPQDTLDALAFANIKTKFLDGAFYDTRLSLSPISVNIKCKERIVVQEDDMRGGLGLEAMYSWGHGLSVKGTTFIPLNNWLLLTPSMSVGKCAGLGVGVMARW